ncbi:hypothetical protein [Nitrincola sp. A-D6]|uniref:hypothetical protein n=1 Tax=Nitrincola sp. A-D6 TaxID=1545442 RepID=UPI0011872351|nr:hypothetical protein [Nitrincola sp. A-D6]
MKRWRVLAGALWVSILLVGCGDPAEPGSVAAETETETKAEATPRVETAAQSLSVIDVSELDVAGASAWWCRFRHHSTRISVSIAC